MIFQKKYIYFWVLQGGECMSTDMSGIYQSFPTDLSEVHISLSQKSKYLILARELPWSKLGEVANMHRSKTVNINNGRPLDLRLHIGAIIAQHMNGWTDRTIADMVQHHGAIRVLCGIEGADITIHDSNLTRFRNQLGPEGSEAVNQIVVQHAALEGFTGSEICSSDTTVQEAAIAHPTEVGHLKKIGEKLVIIAKKVKKGLSNIFTDFQEEAMKIFTELRLFTRGAKEKTIERRKELTRTMHKIVDSMCGMLETAIEEMPAKAQEKYQKEILLFRKIINQIAPWIETGRHPAGKIISLWNQLARAITRNKAAKAVEFGRRWIITRLKNGYIIGGPCQKIGGDADIKIAGEVLAQFLNCFDGQVPESFIYDRGGDGTENHQLLENTGVKNNLIFRLGAEKIETSKEIYAMAKRERALSEAAIAVIKSGKYNFNKPRSKSQDSCITKGHLAILGANLNKFASDFGARGSHLI